MTRTILYCLTMLTIFHASVSFSEIPADKSNSQKPVLVLLGRVELHPEKSTHIHPSYSGLVTKVYKGLGEQVKQGDALATIESNIGIQSHIVRSSINGVILEKSIIEGQPVSEDMEAFTVADTSLVQVSLVAYPRDLAHLKKGTIIYFDTPADTPPHEATISFISPLIDEDTGTTKIFVNLNNASGFWRPGQYIMGSVR